jgi:hypothetical protein
LVIAYRELRLLELDILRAIHKRSSTLSLDVGQFNILCDVDQFYGIEIEEFPAQIAQTALWLMDHQMNMRVSEEYGNYFVRLPLKKSAKIVHGNALQLSWRDVIQPAELNYIFGNPPFGGKQYQNDEQKAELARVFNGVPGAGVLDFVAPWYRLAADYMMANKDIQTGFVSTNSITQGEQVGVLWPDMLKRGVKIHFAHRTFQWSSEARGKAAVHCVIVGFALHDASAKRLFDYHALQGEPHEIAVKNINPYLVDATDTVITNRREPLAQVPAISFGSMPNDGGHLLLSPNEKAELVKAEPKAAKWIRRLVGSEEFINHKERWCLWLVGISPQDLRAMPAVMARVQSVRRERLASSRATTRELAKAPTLFGENRHPTSGKYLLIPSVSSERRPYIPMDLMPSKVVSTNLNLIVPGAELFHFGILSSALHMAWVRSVGGRLKSDYRYSAGIVYNNFPWPTGITKKQTQDVEAAAQAVLDARAKHPRSSLADLYDPLTMPADLVKAHRKLDAVVDAAYSKKKFSGDADRTAFLFEAYEKLINPLVAAKLKQRKSVA